MEEYFVKGAQLILSLSILIVLHELGHFIPAKLFKTRVEKFYLFFNPWFSLLKIKRGETEYGLGWLPLGGYVKISGMIDESMDKDQMASEPQPWEFRSKPAWQRLIIMVGGVTVNLILGFLIFSMVLFIYGRQQLPIENMKYGVMPDSTMMDFGFQTNDRIISVGDGSTKFFSEIGGEVVINGARSFTIERDGQEIQLTMPEDAEQTLLANDVRKLFYPLYEMQVLEPMAGSAAERAGLQPRDHIIRIAGEEVMTNLDGVTVLQNHKEETINLVVIREGEEVELTATVSEKGTLGFKMVAFAGLELETVTYSLWESIPEGFYETGERLTTYVSSLKLLGTKEGVGQMGGFGSIAGMFADTWDWQQFWTMTAFLSLILAFMNILPIPALDGGHVLFLLYEMISGRKPGEKFMEYAQMVGMIILIGLILYANGMDVFRLFAG